MNGSVLALLSAGAVGTFAISDICRPSAPAVRQAAAVSAPALELKTVTLRIEGMTCGGCAIAARKVLERLDGVSKADVSYETQRAVVTYDPAKVSIEQLIAAVKQLGYTATALAASDSSRSPR